MPFTARDLLQANRTPVTAAEDEPVKRIVQKMRHYDFSQIPVVDQENRVLGLVTDGSIIEALHHLGARLDEIYVRDAMTRATKWEADEDLFAVLDQLKSAYAVLIVDRDNRLLDIITTYDTTEYFRQRAEDMMLVNDVETLLRAHVEALFTDQTGKREEEALAQAILDIELAKGTTRGEFQRALKHYLELNGQTGNPDNRMAAAAYAVLKERVSTKPVGELSFNDYVQLLFHGERWPRYCSALGLNSERLRDSLAEIRQIRNALAHFREITNEQRDRLRFLASWFNRYEPVKPEPQPQQAEVDAEIQPVEEEIGPRESRYAGLALHLRSQPQAVDVVQLSFEEVEELIEGELPPTAREHRSWWANDSTSHAQSKQWLDAGWRVSGLNIGQQRVTFTRIEEREDAYIRFFSELISRLRADTGFPVRESLSPGGANWINALGLPRNGRQLASIANAFSWGNRFRVEAYIDTGDQQTNKHVFDQLILAQEELDARVGETLHWERLDTKRASRVALYYPEPINITDDEARLADLLEWAVNANVRMVQHVAPELERILNTLS